MSKVTAASHLKACGEAAKGFVAGLVGELAAQVAEALAELESLKADKPQAVSVVLSASGWLDGGGDYPKYYDIAAPGVTAKDRAEVVIAPDSLETARACGMCGVCETLADKVRVRALRAPTASIAAEYWVQEGKE